MEFKNVDACLDYICSQAFLDLNSNRISLSLEKLKVLIDHVPKKFIDNEQVKKLKELCGEIHNQKGTDNNGRFNFLCDFLPSSKYKGVDKIQNLIELYKAINKDEKSTEDQIWMFENEFILENSIFSRLTKPEDEKLLAILNKWIIQARNEYEWIQAFVYEVSFYKSIDEIKLAKMELRELNKFFELGNCNSIAIHIEKEILDRDFTEQELFKSYLLLLRGQFDLFTNINESEKHGYILDTNWNLAARVQALLWITFYLENIINSQGFNESQFGLNKISMDELVKIKKGFQVITPDKTISKIYNLLVKNNLIKKADGSEKFQKAFQEAIGTITWLGGDASHGKAANSLAYFLGLLLTKKLIKCSSKRDMYIVASKIFKDNSGSFYNADSLYKSSTPKNAKELEHAVNNINKIY